MADGGQLFIIHGPPFAGKSTLAREWVRQTGCACVDIDAINLGRAIGSGGRPITGEEWAASFAESYRQVAVALSAGRPVAYVGHAWSRAQRDRLRVIAAEHGAPTLVIEVVVGEEEARRRLQYNRRPTRHDVSDDNFALALSLTTPIDPDEAAVQYDQSASVAEWLRELLASLDLPRGEWMMVDQSAGERPIVNIVGTQVALGPIRRDLLPTYQRWMNDFATIRTLGTIPRPMTLEQEQAWYDAVATSDRTFTFTIYERGTWVPIGTTSLMDVDWRNRAAEFGILIGDATARGKGYGTETASLMLDHAFVALGLHSVYLRVHEYNLAGRRAYAKAGFRETGRRRASQLMGDRRWDTIYMDCLASEFTSPVLAAVFAPDTPRDAG